MILKIAAFAVVIYFVAGLLVLETLCSESLEKVSMLTLTILLCFWPAVLGVSFVLALRERWK